MFALIYLIFKRLFALINDNLKLEVLEMVKKNKNIEASEAWLMIWGIITYIERFEDGDPSVYKDEGQKSPVSIFVLNGAGNESQQATMDGTILISSDCVAETKAFTAVSTGHDGSHWTSHKKEPNPGNPKYTPISGSVALKEEESIIGAVGVSGREPERKTGGGYRQDQELAELGRIIFTYYQELPKAKQEKHWWELIDPLLDDIVH